MLTMVSSSTYLSICTCVLYLTSKAYCLKDIRSLHKRDINKIDSQTLLGVIKGIDDDLAMFQKRTCAFGINSHHCTLTSLNNKMVSQAWLSDGRSPGKRSDVSPDVERKVERVLDDIVNKRKALMTLQQMLTGLPVMSTDTDTLRKRSCSVRLGGMCLTETLDAAANQYEYLRSGHSPGRKRRSVRF